MNHEEGHAQIAVEMRDGVVISNRVEYGDIQSIASELLEHFNDNSGRAKLIQALPYRLHSLRDGEIYYSNTIVPSNLMPTHMTYESIGSYISRTLHWWSVLPQSMTHGNGETVTFDFPTHWYLYTITGRWMYMNRDMNIPEALTMEVVQNG